MLSLALETRVGAVALDVALEVPDGGCLALAGPSGAGKTSVLRMVAGLSRRRAAASRAASETWLDTARGIDVAPERARAAATSSRTTRCSGT